MVTSAQLKAFAARAFSAQHWSAPAPEIPTRWTSGIFLALMPATE
jgi:hypothetical protein